MSSIISGFILVLLAMSHIVGALGPTAVPLGTSANYTILAQTGVSTVPASAITGAIGLSPAPGSYLTGFALILAPDGTYATSTQVTGKLYSASYTSPTPSQLAVAILDMGIAYTNAANRVNPDYTNLASGLIGGLTLKGGLYKWTSGVNAATSFTISGTNTDTWIFQVAGTLTTGAAASVILAGGAQAKNIVWVVAGSVDFGVGSHFEGIVLTKTAATLETGATANGRILAQTFVALQKATIVAPA